MSVFGQIYTALLLAIGAYLIATQNIIGVSKKMRTAVLAQTREKSSVFDALTPVAVWVAKQIRLPELSKAEWQKKFTILGIKTTPEQYIAQAIVSAVAVFLLFNIIAIWVPIVILLSAFVAINFYRQTIGYVNKRLEQRRLEIQDELPHFASVIAQYLKQTRNVLQILESYKTVASDTLAEELTITIADMKTGHHETALHRMGNRLNSAELSQIVRGLQAVVRGEDQRLYFEVLQAELRKSATDIRKKKEQLRAMRLNPYRIAIVGLIIVSLFYGMGHYFLSSLATFF